MKKLFSFFIAFVLLISCVSISHAAVILCPFDDCTGLYGAICEKCGSDYCCVVCGHCEDCSIAYSCECDFCIVCYNCNENFTQCPKCESDTSYCEKCNQCINEVCNYQAVRLPEGTVLHTDGTEVILSGKYTEAAYTITVPATLHPGETGDVVVSGAWKSTQTLTVSCPNKVSLSYKEQTIDICVIFAGITQVGSDISPFNISTPVTIENRTVAFGTWAGILEYDVEFIDSEIQEKDAS